MQVVKKDGSKVLFDENKILIAIKKSADRAGVELTQQERDFVLYRVKTKALSVGDVIEVNKLHKAVCEALDRVNSLVGDSYRSYRDYKTSYCKSFDKIFKQSEGVLYSEDKENANFDSTLTSTKGSLMRGYLTNELYEKFYMSRDEKEACKNGFVYIHDKKDLIFNSFNCFSGDTKFISSEGVKSFNSFNDGDILYVPTHLGNWKKAVVRCFGEQATQDVYFKRSCGKEKKVTVTPDHRWILKDGSETTNLSVGHRLVETPSISDYVWSQLTDSDKKLWCMGFNMGDGCQIKGYDDSYIRLCGDKVKWAGRFVEAGYTVTFPPCYKGDGWVSLLGVKKRVPTELLNHSNTKVFVSGFMCADGNYNVKKQLSTFRGVCVCGELNNEIKSLLSMSGYYVTTERDVTHVDTNYGKRTSTTINYQTYEKSGHRTWKVDRIENTGLVQNVWCLVVEDDHSFLLDGGIPTGNCCLFDMSTVLDGGFEMANIKYNEPNSALTALQVIGDITLVTTAQQFGGQQ